MELNLEISKQNEPVPENLLERQSALDSPPGFPCRRRKRRKPVTEEQREKARATAKYYASQPGWREKMLAANRARKGRKMPRRPHFDPYRPPNPAAQPPNSRMLFDPRWGWRLYPASYRTPEEIETAKREAAEKRAAELSAVGRLAYEQKYVEFAGTSVMPAPGEKLPPQKILQDPKIRLDPMTGLPLD